MCTFLIFILQSQKTYIKKESGFSIYLVIMKTTYVIYLESVKNILFKLLIKHSNELKGGLQVISKRK